MFDPVEICKVLVLYFSHSLLSSIPLAFGRINLCVSSFATLVMTAEISSMSCVELSL